VPVLLHEFLVQESIIRNSISAENFSNKFNPRIFD
jgi:hypothetical protein